MATASRATLLVADGDGQAVETVARAAARVGLKLAVAENGVQALERFRAELPTVAIIDRLLPVLDGLQVAQKIRETLAGKTVAILLTGIPDGPGAGTTARADRAALSDTLGRPLVCDDLMRALLPFLPAADEPAGPQGNELPGRSSFDVVGGSLARALVDVVAEKRTGELRWTDGRLLKGLWFERGTLVGGRSNGRRDLWPSWVARDPFFDARTRSRLASLAVPGPGAEGWAQYLEGRGILTGDAFASSRERWLVALALELARRDEGRAAFVDGRPRDPGFARIDGPSLAVLALRLASGEAFADLLPSPLCLLDREVERADELGLTQVEQEVLSLADRSHTVGDLIALGRLTEHDLAPCLYGLLALGLVRPMASEGGAGGPAEVSRMPEEIGTSGVRRQGDLGDARLAQLIGTISAAGLTGLLQLRREHRQLVIHLSAGRIVFARSNDSEHRLGNVLVRRGKISGQDHARALALLPLQPPRRLGAILLGMGALSLKELHQGLCAQVREILEQAFRWPDAAYAFLEGALPTDDMVSVDVSTPNLLLECLRGLPLDELARQHAPPAEAVLFLHWQRERVEALLRPTPAEEAVLSAAHHGVALNEAVLLAGDRGEEAARAVFALLGIGCLEAAPAGSRRRPRDESSSGGRAGDGDPSQLRGEIEALRAANLALRNQVARIESENRRLRSLASAAETVHLG